MNFYKVIVLPPILMPDSLYFVQNGDYAEFYITDKFGNAKKGGNSEMIQELSSQGIEIEFASPNVTWIINHNKGYNPIVQLYNTGSQAIWADLTHTSENQVVATFTAPTSGFARII